MIPPDPVSPRTVVEAAPSVKPEVKREIPAPVEIPRPVDAIEAPPKTAAPDISTIENTVAETVREVSPVGFSALPDVVSLPPRQPEIESRVEIQRPVDGPEEVHEHKFIEQDDPVVYTPEQRRTDRTELAIQPGDDPGRSKATVTVSPEPLEETRFFVRTAEIIEKGGDVAPQDIGSILMQEVREWVSAEPETEVGEKPQPLTPEIRVIKEASQIEREPGVRVIGEKTAQEFPRETAALEEQSFELSIGSISVVIEGDENPPAPVRTIQNNPGPSREPAAKRSYSRFGRNYL
jgi:hypothetical protein